MNNRGGTAVRLAVKSSPLAVDVQVFPEHRLAPPVTSPTSSGARRTFREQRTGPKGSTDTQWITVLGGARYVVSHKKVLRC